LAAVVAAGFVAGAVFAAGLLCDAAEHAAAISRQIEKQIRIDAPERRTLPGRAGGTPAPTWIVMTAKYDSILES
jgi:hypothetical protein